MNSSTRWSRRSLLQLLSTGSATALLGSTAHAMATLSSWAQQGIRQSVCQWCYADLALEELAAGAVDIGLQSIELIGPQQFKVVKQYGLTCAVANGTGPIHDCLNRPANHDRCERELRKAIEFAASEKIPNVICFSGNRDGMADDEGLENCFTALRRVVGLAERMQVTIVLELLNSKIDHLDYMGDRMEWGVRLVERVGSPRFKLLYDIYHMQIMEGDIIRTIRTHRDHIAHYHTGGVPGRHEIDETQELNYPAIVEAILDTGYTGYLGQEFIPSRDPLTSLAQGFRICDV